MPPAWISRSPYASLMLQISDNGEGLPGVTGSYEPKNIGPLSLRNRIAELKGSLALSSSPTGYNTGPSDMIVRKHSIHVVIADDHPRVLEGLANLIASDPDFTLLASCPDGEQCLRAIRH